jgi:2,3-dihydroxybenzoate decarboxylase
VLGGRPELYGATWSWAAETGGHALRVIYGEVFDRHPSAALILGHMSHLNGNDHSCPLGVMR